MTNAQRTQLEVAVTNAKNMMVVESLLAIGSVVNYTNGGLNIQTGTVKGIDIKNHSTHLLIIDEKDSSLVELYNAGVACGDYISLSQLINNDCK